MKLFKTIDEKFAEIGFEKIAEDEYGAFYEREGAGFGYTQCLDITYEADDSHIHSYQKDVNSDGLNNAVALTPYETKLILKKIKKMEKAAGNDMACYL